mgnify:FL=1
MIGVDNIVRMRKAGQKPSSVFVEMLPMQKWARQYAEKSSRYVDLHMDEKDALSPDLLDLRCLAGIGMVYVNGPDSELTEKMARACFKAGAKVVHAFCFDVSNPNRVNITKALRLSAEGEKCVWPQ